MMNKIKEMKHTILICIALLSSLAVSAKDFHFVYIRYDNSMIKSELIEQIKGMKSSFSSGDYVVYYSNAQTVMDSKSWNEDELFGLITEQMSYPAISIPDEVELISESLEKYMELDFEDEDTNKRIFSANNYSAVFFDCLVGKEFVASKNPNGLLARTFIVNSLNKSNFDVKLKYYPCGSNYGENDLQFNLLYQLNIQPQLVK
jgi:hypothetical protein